MKFSELSTDRAADVLCEVSVYALNILTDDELRESLKAQIDAEKPQTAGERYAIGAQKIGQWIPLILKKHREDTLGILAAVNETTVEAIKKQSIIKTMRQIQEIVRDKDMLDFFKSCASEAKGETLGLLAAPKISVGGLIRLLPILVKRQQEESAFRIYTAECLRTMTENTAKFAGGSFVQAKYSDLIDPKPQDNRTCEEITAEGVKRCGLVVKDESI